MSVDECDQVQQQPTKPTLSSGIGHTKKERKKERKKNRKQQPKTLGVITQMLSDLNVFNSRV
jgi:hypothetical protein